MQYKDKKCHPAHCSPKWARGYGQVWLLRNGALSSLHDAVDGGGIDAMVMRRDLDPSEWDEDRRLPLLSWAQDAVTTYEHFHLFLNGTILSSSSFRRHPNTDYATRSRNRIHAYTGYPTTAHEVRTYQQLTQYVSAFIEDVPFTSFVEEEDDDDDDDY